MDCDIIQTDGDFDDVWAFFTSYTSDTVNTPRDITAYTPSAGMQRDGSEDDPITFTTSNGLSIENGNQVVIHVPTETVKDWPTGTYTFDLVLIDGSGHRQGRVFQQYQLVKGYAP